MPFYERFRQKLVFIALLCGGVGLIIGIGISAANSPGTSLTPQQRADLIYINGIRNAQKSENAFQERIILKQTLVKIRTLKQQNSKMSLGHMNEDRAVKRREKQLEKMIARGIANETL